MSKLPLQWPEIEVEMKDYLSFFKGRVLNAGAGNRDLSAYVDGELVNQDIDGGLHNENIQIYSPLHEIPVEDDHFDAIICNAVLEHVRNPHEVLDEFYRVLKPGGYLYLGVPFMQPEHLDPTDFQRYTKDGLCELVHRHRFDVERIEGLHNVYHTLAWIVHEWLNSSRSVTYFVLRRMLYPVLWLMSRNSRHYVDSIASAYRVLARKPLQTA